MRIEEERRAKEEEEERLRIANPLNSLEGSAIEGGRRCV